MLDFVKTYVKQEVAVVVFVAAMVFIGGGLGCSALKTVSPISGERVSGEQLSAEATQYQLQTSAKLGEILAKVGSLEAEYLAVVDDHDMMAEAFSGTYDALKKREDGLAAMWSQALSVVSGSVPVPWQPAFSLLAGAGTLAFGGGYIRKELLLKKINREIGRGPRGERLSEDG